MRVFHHILSRARSLAGRARAVIVPVQRQRASVAATIDLDAAAIARDPFPHYEELRRAGPVQFLPRHNAWIVLSYDDVHFGFTHPDLFSNGPYKEVDAVLLGADPPEHPAIRRIVSRYFSPVSLERLCAFAAQHALSLLQSEMDVVRDYGLPLSEAVAAHFLGFDTEAIDAIHAARAEAPELAPYTRALDGIAARATMYSQLLGDGLGDTDARSLVRLLWLAATTTTERVIARSVLRLLQHDDVRRMLESETALIPSFVEEVLRLHPPEHLLPRMTTGSVKLGGMTIPAGSVVHLCVAAANRDPDRFERPSEVQLNRGPLRHYSFGFGIHHCVGATLGRRTIEIAVRTLLARAPRFRGAQPLDTVVNWCTMTASPVGQLRVELYR